ncbi:MAG: hypothetical protein AB1755_00440 [Candidatus Omnitrophota bacterium]
MSIIYDALRRTQEKIMNIEEKPKTKMNFKKNMPVILAIFILGIVFLYSNRLFLGHKDNKNDSSNLPAGLYGRAKDIIKDKEFVLSGIAYDESNAWAVINDKILKQGDFIRKAQITKISQDRVELALDENKRLVLTAKQD